MDTFLALLVIATPFATALLATLGLHRSLFDDGYRTGRPPAQAPWSAGSWSSGSLPSRPYASRR